MEARPRDLSFWGLRPEHTSEGPKQPYLWIDTAPELIAMLNTARRAFYPGSEEKEARVPGACEGSNEGTQRITLYSAQMNPLLYFDGIFKL